MTQVIRSTADWKKLRKNLPSQLGFVPTMGALHQGHLELIKRSIQENQTTVVSIFVNPTQFNNTSDLKNYPKTLEQDLHKLNQLGVDYLFYPNFEDMYPDNYRYKITENLFSKELCGAYRPGHFDGVLTVVMKLLNLIAPGKAYFGEKDFQQLQLVKDMASAFFIPAEIIACKTVREESGLALSSRNSLLSKKGKEKAALFAQALKMKNLKHVLQELKKQAIEVEYLKEDHNRRFAAVHIDGVRLIDNVPI